MEDNVTSDRSSWLNRNVLGISLTSLFSDMSHEMATAILPFFVIFVLGGNAAIVGLIEGSADGLASLFKSYSGYHSDKSGKRLPIMYLGYLATGILIPAIGFATNLVEVFLLRVGAWIGRGARGRREMPSCLNLFQPSSIGKAFGFERASGFSWSCDWARNSSFADTIYFVFKDLSRFRHPRHYLRLSSIFASERSATQE